MQREDRQEWAEAYNKEYQGFIEQGTLIIARPEKGAKVLDTTTRADYKVTNGVFDKRKIRLCACGNKKGDLSSFSIFSHFLFSHFLIFAVSEEDCHVPKAYAHMHACART